MSPEEEAKYSEIMDWYSGQRLNKDVDIVEIVRERLARTTNVAETKALLQILETELRIRQRFDEAENVLNQQIALDPIDPLPLIGLATLRLYFQDNPQQALEDIDQAIVKTQATGHFRRHALNTKARILLRLADYPALERCLIDILETRIVTGQYDIQKERDFFDHTPPGSISEATRKRYLEYLQKPR